jgi:hypothetical protein
VVSPDFTKFSVCSLLSTAVAIRVKRIMQKKKVIRIFLSIYQSSFFILPAKEMIIDERFCEEIM